MEAITTLHRSTCTHITPTWSPSPMISNTSTSASPHPALMPTSTRSTRPVGGNSFSLVSLCHALLRSQRAHDLLDSGQCPDRRGRGCRRHGASCKHAWANYGWQARVPPHAALMPASWMVCPTTMRSAFTDCRGSTFARAGGYIHEPIQHSTTGARHPPQLCVYGCMGVDTAHALHALHCMLLLLQGGISSPSPQPRTLSTFASLSQSHLPSSSAE